MEGLQALTTLIGAKPRPRLLVVASEGRGFEGYVPAVGSLVPTIRFVTPDQLQHVRQAEWDAVVLFDVQANLAPHLFVIQFGSISEEIRLDTVGVQIVRGTSVATEFLINPELPQEVRTLVRADLLPWVTVNEQNEMLALQINAYFVSRGDTVGPTIADVVVPFLSDGDHQPLAGRFTRNGGASDWWMLPWTGGAYLTQWIAAALNAWSEDKPDRFPTSPNWQSRTEWQTPAEQKALDALRDLSGRRAQVLLDLDREESILRENVAEARVAADASERRLLTAQGDELVESVKDALTEIGFQVADVDELRASPGDYLEDLRVTDPEQDDWIALVEVRGYTKGAQLNDLLRIGRFVTRYIVDHGHPPTATWYIVNHFCKTDPSTRTIPLQGNAQEVATFGPPAST